MNSGESPPKLISLDAARKDKQDREAETRRQRIEELSDAINSAKSELRLDEVTTSITLAHIRANTERIQELESAPIGTVESIETIQELEQLKRTVEQERKEVEQFQVDIKENRETIQRLEQELLKLTP